ncbi:MAG: response regulator [Lachnospiraceae bacterium]|nr:response regulator [Lachnospiraceae bacterium]
MSIYASGALASLTIYGMAMIAIVLGFQILKQDNNVKAGRRMFALFVSVYLWDTGYAWMGLCYDDEFAYIARAIALAGVYIYMVAILEYVGQLSGYPVIRRYVFYVPVLGAAIVSWIKIIDKESVSFQATPWGYWYVSKMTWGRYVQFAVILAALVFYYVMIRYWRNCTRHQRERMIINRFMLFGPIMFAGYTLDTLVPSLFDMPAIPGSAIAAFIAAIIHYRVSRRYMALGISETNISSYVFRDVNVPVLIIDEDGRIAMWNRIAPSYFNKDENELLGLTRDDLVSLPEEDELLGETRSEEVYKVLNTEEFCRLSSTVYYDEFGDQMYTICFVQDVTDMQKALHMMNESKTIAEAANESKSAFMANMSHEIRTPMNAIIGMSDILLEDPDIGEEEHQQLRNIREAGDTLLGIINDMLDISKIEAGKNDLVDDKYLLAEMIKAVNSIIMIRIANTSLEYIVDVDPELPKEIIGDELRVRQILINLLGNAVKFTEHGYIHFKMWGEREFGGVRIFVDIADTGIGMREEDLKNIFDAFNQVDTHKNRTRQGVGLGLSISLRLAQAMDGDITVESTYGKGTVFHLTYFQRLDEYEPIGEEVATAIRDDNLEYEEKEKEFEYTKHPDKYVLVVDDSKVNLMVAKGLLSPYGMEIDLADNGMFAIELAKNNDYDCIFMDHMMPVMDGVETAHAIRDIGGHCATVPIIALTANAIDGTREFLLGEGMQDFITKPIDKKLLNDIIEKYLG